MDTTESETRAVSPVMGVILVVAITIALSGVVGVFVFDLGQSVSDGQTSADIATRTTFTDDGNATIQVVTGESDELRVLVNGTQEGSISNPSAGSSIKVPATTASQITIVSESDGQTTVVTSSSAVSTSSPSVTAPTTGLVSLYPFNDSSTSTTGIDSTGTNNLTLENGAIYVTGIEGSALGLDGSNQYAHVASDTSWAGEETGTISLWFNAADNSTSQDLISADDPSNNDGDSAFTLLNDGTLRVNIDWNFGGGQMETTRSFERDKWYHIVVVWNETAEHTDLYVNGSFEQDKGFAGNFGGSGQHLAVGATYYGGTPDRFFNGTIENVRYYNTTLNATQANDIYESETP